MTILHISTAQTWRGGEAQIANLLDELNHHDVKCILLAPESSVLSHHQYIASTTKVYTFLKRGSIDLQIVKIIEKIVTDEHVDLIHAHDSHAHSHLWLSYVIGSVSVSSVVTRRANIKVSWLSRWKYNHSKIKRIVCVSQSVYDSVATGISDKNRLQIIYSGVDLSRYSAPSPLQIREHLGLSSDALLVGNVAAISPVKDYTSFVNVAMQIIKQRSDIHFVIIGGDAGDQSRIESMVSDLHLSDHIHFLGHVEGAYTLIPQLDVFLFPSIQEGLGTSILDAFASQVPVVSSNAGGIPELVQHEETGYLCQVGDITRMSHYVLKCIAGGDEIQRVVENAKATLHKYDKSQMSEKYIQLYHKIVNPR